MVAKDTTAKAGVAAKALSDKDLAAVSGGGTALSSAVSNAIKAIGEGLTQAARKG
jgi:bacteriocin-like protein